MAPDIHQDLTPFAAWLGRWRGEGHGSYPTTEPFRYGEEMVFASVVGESFVLYEARSWEEGDEDAPLHFERGFFRPGADPGQAELALAHPLGVTEISSGTIENGSLRLTSSTIGRTPTGAAVTGLVRRYDVDGETLTYELDMSMDQVAMVFHGKRTPPPDRLNATRPVTTGSRRRPRR
jgi:hypothetical protein